MKNNIWFYLTLFFLVGTNIGFSQTFPAPYCSVSVSADVEPITYVKFAGIENISSAAINGSPAHEDFTHLVGTVCPGTTYELLFRGNTNGFWDNDIFVYIDWNQDGTFDQANERYYLGWIEDSDGSSPTYTADIEVPSDALIGTTRMRVLKKFSDSSHTPCGTIGYGQAEDYTIVVSSPNPDKIGYTSLLTTAPSISENNWSNSWCAGSGTGTPIENLIAGVGYSIEHNPTQGNCSSYLTDVLLQVWGEGNECNNLSPIGAIASNSLDFVAPQSGDYQVNVSSNSCFGTANTSCQFGYGHDFSGQSAALRYKQSTTINNTTSTDDICINNEKQLSYTLGNSHNNPEVTWSITQGQSLGSINNNIFTPSGLGQVTIRASVGVAYSEISFEIVDNSEVYTDTITLCVAQLPYTWHGITWDVNTIPGNYSESVSYTNSDGCDSIHNLELIINDLYQATENIMLCENDLPSIWNGQTIPANLSPGTYTNYLSFTTTDMNGCDSQTYLDLTINETEKTIIQETICESDLPYQWNGLSFGTNTIPGFYQDSVVLTNINGCDSTVFLELTINPNYQDYESLVICESQLPYAWNSETIPVGTIGTQTFTYNYTSQLNCDSIVNLEVTVHPTYYITIDTILCENDSLFIGNEVFTNAVTNHLLYFNTTEGCDSIIDLTLSYNPEINISWDGSSENLCFEDTITINASHPNGHSYLWSTGATLPVISIAQGGTYSVTIKDEDNVCETTASITYTERPLPHVNIHTGQNIYCDTDTITLNAGSDGVLYLWNTGDTTSTIEVNETGYYHVMVQNEYGCINEDEVELEFYTTASFDDWTKTHLGGYKYQFKLTNPQNIVAYHWDFGDETTSNLPQPIHTYDGPGVYTVFLTITSECEDQVYYKILELDKVNVNELDKDKHISIYPNPANVVLNVDFPENINIERYRILDISGRIYKNTKMEEKQTSIQVNIAELVNGVYFIELETKEGIIRKKFSVNK